MYVKEKCIYCIGLYARNISCYFLVKHREQPPCKRVLIQLSQLLPHKVQLRSITDRGLGGFPSPDTTANSDAFMAWEECGPDRDSLTVYDGTTSDAPVLLKICGGSYIPPVTSSSPEIMLAFHSTAFGNPLEPKPPAPYPVPLRGFELDVDIITVDSQMADYTNNHSCIFYVSEQRL